MTFDPDALQRQLERDLETVRRYKDLVARQGGKAAQGELRLEPPKRQAPPVGKVAPSAGKQSLAAIVESRLTDQWQDAGFFHEQVKAGGWPKSARSAVATSLRRLVGKGVAEKRGDKTVGIEFRRHQSA